MARKKADKADKVKQAAPARSAAEISLSKSGLKSAVVEIPVPNTDSCPAVSNRQKIEMLAYSYWEQRGRQGGSPEEDWFRAEREINRESSN